ncbi:MAG: hypothetical protein AB9842_00235 [Bacteroidales bacterium]
MNDLDLTGEYKALQRELKDVKELYITLVLKLQDLTETVKPNLEALYMMKIGAKELEFLQRQAETAGIKLKMELMIACLNKNEAIDLGNIDQQVEQELLNYYNAIQQLAEKIDDAQSHLSQLMTGEESVLLRSLYFDLAKRFHPDVNADLTEDQKRLWNIICEAYAIGDLVTLKNLHLATGEKADFSDLMADYDAGKRQVEIFTEKNTALLSRIGGLESEFPFTLKDNLKDESWIKSEQQRIDNKIQALAEEAEKYEEYINLILGN